MNIFGETTSGRKSPSNASVVSVPIRRAGTPQDYNEKVPSERSNNKDQRLVGSSLNKLFRIFNIQ